jgi:hypothetical protein
MFNPITPRPRPSDRVSRGQYSTSCKVMKSSLHLPPAALRQGVARIVFDLVRSHEVFFFTFTTRGPQNARVRDRARKARKAVGGGAIADRTTNAKSAHGNDP